MVSIELLREWAGLGTDGSQDPTLKVIADGVEDFIAKGTNRILRCPPGIYEQVLDVPKAHGGGLSRIHADTVQRLRLREEPYRQIVGSVTVSAGGTTVTGTGTTFTRSLSAVGSDADAPRPTTTVNIDGEISTVATITDDETFELTDAHVAGAAETKLLVGMVTVESRSDPSSAWLRHTPGLFEIDGRALYTTSKFLPPGKRTVRVRYLLGYEEGDAPSDISLLLLQMVKSVFNSKRRRSKSIAVEGSIRVTWAAFKDEAEAFAKKLDNLKVAMSFSTGSAGRFLKGTSAEWV